MEITRPALHPPWPRFRALSPPTAWRFSKLQQQQRRRREQYQRRRPHLPLTLGDDRSWPSHMCSRERRPILEVHRCTCCPLERRPGIRPPTRSAASGHCMTKFIVPGPALEKSKYNAQKPLEWLQDTRDYVEELKKWMPCSLELSSRRRTSTTRRSWYRPPWSTLPRAQRRLPGSYGRC